MYIRVLLEHKDNEDPNSVLARIFKEGNTNYLVKGERDPDFPYLSQVESCDHAVFAPKRMNRLIYELLKVRKEVPDTSDKAHIDDIIHLAERCKNTPDTVLVFAG